MKKNYITRQEAAEIFNVHPQTIKNWIDRGLLLAGKRATTGTLVDFQSVEALQASFGNIKEAERNIKEYNWNKSISKYAGTLGTETGYTAIFIKTVIYWSLYSV